MVGGKPELYRWSSKLVADLTFWKYTYVSQVTRISPAAPFESTKMCDMVTASVGGRTRRPICH